MCNKAGLNCTVERGSVPGEGINGADFVFYVSAMSTERCKKGLTVAYAAHCQQEAALDRYVSAVLLIVLVLVIFNFLWFEGKLTDRKF